MKKTGICPKCGSQDIILLPANKKVNAYIDFVIDGRHFARVDRYVCRNCGYIEEYVVKEDVKKIQIK